jgi:hypothetical protein
MIEGNCVLEATLPSCPYTLRNKLKVYMAVLFSFGRVFVFTSYSNCFVNHGRGKLYKKKKGYEEKLLEMSSNKRRVVGKCPGEG